MRMGDVGSFLSSALDESEWSAACPRHSNPGERSDPTVSTEKVTSVGSRVKLDALEKTALSFAGTLATIPGSSKP
jgi:hypothetical protein